MTLFKLIRLHDVHRGVIYVNPAYVQVVAKDGQNTRILVGDFQYVVEEGQVTVVALIDGDKDNV